MTISAAHHNMVEQQIRPWNVHSSNLLQVITDLDRRCFVPESKSALCYMDVQIELDDGLKMLEPKVAAHMVQALNLHASDRVLVVGAGSGYTAALCAGLAYNVICVDSSADSISRAQRNCVSAGVTNIDFEQLNQNQFFESDNEFDGVLMRSRQAEAPFEYFRYMASKGSCVAQVGNGYVNELMCYTSDEGQIKTQSLLDLLNPAAYSSAKPQFEF